MYCPRCGSANPDATKFCRQCGLALTQLSGYVASGGTAPLPQSQPTSPNQPHQSKPSKLIANATEGLTPKQKMVLTILLLAFSPAIFGVFGEVSGMGKLAEALAGVSAILMPIGIVFTVMRYKAQQRRLEQAMTQQPLYSPVHQAMPPGAPQGLPQPGQQPIQQPTASPRNHQPVYQQPSPPPTNPLPGSVTEDETKRLQ